MGASRGARISPRRRREISENERALWRHAMRDAKPLSGRPVVTPPLPEIVESAPQAIQEPAPVAVRIVPKIPAAPLVLARRGPVPGLDGGTTRRLRAGEMEIEARLDLHGMTHDRAFERFGSFMELAWQAGKRVVLVITGKGSGILRSSLPVWVQAAPQRGRILAFLPAQPRHGGDGAFYLLLRRPRE